MSGCLLCLEDIRCYVLHAAEQTLHFINRPTILERIALDICGDFLQLNTSWDVCDKDIGRVPIASEGHCDTELGVVVERVGL